MLWQSLGIRTDRSTGTQVLHGISMVPMSTLYMEISHLFECSEIRMGYDSWRHDIIQRELCTGDQDIWLEVPLLVRNYVRPSKWQIQDPTLFHSYNKAAVHCFLMSLLVSAFEEAKRYLITMDEL